jgi:hypothetical protein
MALFPRPQRADLGLVDGQKNNTALGCRTSPAIESNLKASLDYILTSLWHCLQAGRNVWLDREPDAAKQDSPGASTFPE